jgi:anti-sigma regulatory factor (Ser/Thr protein kinase)
VDLRLRAGPDAPAIARRALAEDHVPDELLEDAQLVVSELVTNGVRHGGSDPTRWLGVRARLRPGGLRIEVCDPGPGFAPPPPLPRSGSPVGGRGLPIVDRLARRWGAGRTADGRWEVWAEIDRRDPADPSSRRTRSHGAS